MKKAKKNTTTAVAVSVPEEPKAPFQPPLKESDLIEALLAREKEKRQAVAEEAASKIEGAKKALEAEISKLSARIAKIPPDEFMVNKYGSDYTGIQFSFPAKYAEDYLKAKDDLHRLEADAMNTHIYEDQFRKVIREQLRQAKVSRLLNAKGAREALDSIASSLLSVGKSIKI